MLGIKIIFTKSINPATFFSQETTNQLKKQICLLLNGCGGMMGSKENTNAPNMSLNNDNFLVHTATGMSVQQPLAMLPNTQCKFHVLKTAQKQLQGALQAFPLPHKSRCIEPEVTTLIVRNVPKHYNLAQLLKQWTPDGSYNLLFYPYNLKMERRLGFCFINFLSNKAALKFHRRWHQSFLPKHNSNKALDIDASNDQGFKQNLEHFRGKNIEWMNDPELLPAIFEGKHRIDARKVFVNLGFIRGPKDSAF